MNGFMGFQGFWEIFVLGTMGKESGIYLAKAFNDLGKLFVLFDQRSKKL